MDMMELSNLTEAERDHILTVLGRDENLRQREQERIRKLKSEVKRLRMRGVIKEGQDANRTCARCRQTFGWIFNKGALCPTCQHRVCDKCQVTADGKWLCVLCHKQMELEAMTNHWFYSKFRKSKRSRKTNAVISGTDIIRSSFRKTSRNSNGTRGRPHTGTALAGNSLTEEVKRAIYNNNSPSKSPHEARGTRDDARGAPRDEVPRESAAFPQPEDKALLQELIQPKRSQPQQQQRVHVQRVTSNRFQDSDSDDSPPPSPLSGRHESSLTHTDSLRSTRSSTHSSAPSSDGRITIITDIGGVSDMEVASVDIPYHNSPRDYNSSPHASKREYHGASRDYPGTSREHPPQYHKSSTSREYQAPSRESPRSSRDNPSSSRERPNVPTQNYTSRDNYQGASRDYQSSPRQYHDSSQRVDPYGQEHPRTSHGQDHPRVSRTDVQGREHPRSRGHGDQYGSPQGTRSKSNHVPGRDMSSDRGSERSSELSSDRSSRGADPGRRSHSPPRDADPTRDGSASSDSDSEYARESLTDVRFKRMNRSRSPSPEYEQRRTGHSRQAASVANGHLAPPGGKLGDRMVAVAARGSPATSRNSNSSERTQRSTVVPSVAVCEGSPRSQTSRKSGTETEDENIDELFASHASMYSANESNLSKRSSNLLTPFSKKNKKAKDLAASRESIASYYSDAGEVNYGKIPVTGEILFGLDYNYKNNMFEVHIKQCRDLAPVDTKRKRSDPYVKTYLLPDKTKSGKRKTRVKKHTLNPTFEETLRYQLTKSELENRTLWLTVWHNDTFGRNDFLGEVTIPMDDWSFQTPAPQWHKLMDRPHGIVDEHIDPLSKLAYKGDLVVSLKFVTSDHLASKKRSRAGERGELHVVVKEAKNLTAVRANGSSDPFCKGYLLPEKTKHAKQKTPVKKRDCNPRWNHTFVFEDIALADLSERALELTVWDHDRFTSNDFLGGVRLSIGSGTSGGRPVDWMDSQGEEISVWRSMLDRPNCWIEGTLLLRPSMSSRK